MKRYKFKCGDLVRINVTCPSKRHFQTGVIAWVGRNYSQICGGEKTDSFSVQIIADANDVGEGYSSAILWAMSQKKTHGVSWYTANEFELIESGDDASELHVRRLEDRK